MRFSILSVATFAAGALAQCNGNAALCSRQYPDVSQIGTHDSAFVGSLPTDNQAVDVTGQLNAGIRFLQAQTHSFAGSIMLCHTSCFEEDSGELVTYLGTISTWMDANPNEVITLLLTNGDGIAMSTFALAFESSGLAKYAYAPTTKLALADWPTLQELISANTRLVTFMDAGADVATVPFILDEFTYFFETPYDTTDPTFNECTLDRPAGGSADGRMYIVNHFLDLDIFGIDIPDVAADAQTNAATGSGSIGAQVSLCFGIYGRNPTFVLVDNFNTGDVFTAQKNLNGL